MRRAAQGWCWSGLVPFLPAGGRAKIACQLAGLLSLIHTFSEYGDDFVNDV